MKGLSARTSRPKEIVRDFAPCAVTCQLQIQNRGGPLATQASIEVPLLLELVSLNRICANSCASGLRVSKLIVIPTAGTREMSVTHVHISAPAHCWSRSAQPP